MFALSAAASVAAVAVVGWISFQSIDQSQQNANAIAANTSVPAPARMNDYLLAHQEFSPSTAMQGVAPYVRTVADAQGQRR